MFLQQILIIIIKLLINSMVVYKECIINSNNITNPIILLQVIMEVIILLDMLCINNNSMTHNSNRLHLNISSNNSMEVNTDSSSKVLVVGTNNILEEEAGISRWVIKVTKTSDNPKCPSNRLGTNTNTETSSTPNNMWMYLKVITIPIMINSNIKAILHKIINIPDIFHHFI